MSMWVPSRSSDTPQRRASRPLAILSVPALGFLLISADTGHAAPPAPAVGHPCLAKPSSARIANVRAAAYGAKANGQDDTDAIQKALDAIARTGGTVLIPAGTYMVNAVRHTDGGNHGLAIKSNTTLRLAPGAVLKAIPNSAPGYAIVRIADARNVNITGGVIEGDRSAHKGTEGQWGMGISLLNSQDVVVAGVNAKECWGDGFYVGGATGCSNVRFCNVTADHNRREGLSIVNASGVVVLDSSFKNTAGTEPECGLDLEPNEHQAVTNVRIANCSFTNNVGGGMWGGPPYASRHVSFLTGSIVEKCSFSGNGAKLSNGAVLGLSACSGNIIRDNVLTGNFGVGIMLRSEALNHLVTGNLVTGTKGDGIRLEDCAGSRVTGNTVTGYSGYGIRPARGHGATIGDNTVANNGKTP